MNLEFIPKVADAQYRELRDDPDWSDEINIMVHGLVYDPGKS